MAVACSACQTENRDNAMFCRGCAGKLPAFAATGPAALDILQPLRLAPTAHAAARPAPAAGMLSPASRGFWLRIGLLALAITVGFVVWYAYVTRRTAPPALPAASAPPLRPVQAPVPAAEALGPGETLAPVGPAARAPVPLPVDGFAARDGADWRELAPPQRRNPPDTPINAPVRSAGADPRPACAQLNFIAAARCEAAQCRKAEYRTHPHCDAVREQTRRDIARRDLAY